MKRFKRIVACLMVFAVVISSTAVGVNAKAKKFYLPSKATVYLYNGDTGKWEKNETKTIKYNSKGDPTVYGNQRISYTYKKGKRTKMVIKNDGEWPKTTYYYNSKGVLYKTSLEGKVYFNKYNWRTKTSDGYQISYRKYKSGYPKRISSDLDFTDINTKGLPAVSSLHVYGETLIFKYVYTYDKKGRVKTAIQQIQGEDGKWHNELKVIYAYPKKAKTTTLRRKWAVVIASAMTAEGNGLELGPFFEATQANAVYDTYYVY